jgi:hypothetical protein
MSDRTRNRETQLERLFAESRALPGLVPDPDLPAHIRALAATRFANEGRPAGASRRGWAWASFATAAFALSIATGGYVGYRLWATTQETRNQQMSDSDALTAAFSQSGFADDLAGGEVEE